VRFIVDIQPPMDARMLLLSACERLSVDDECEAFGHVKSARLHKRPALDTTQIRMT
jgi:hypothetical protein